MTEDDIDNAVSIILKDKALKAKLNLTKDNVYWYRHKATISTKLELLYKAGKLQLND